MKTTRFEVVHDKKPPLSNRDGILFLAGFLSLLIPVIGWLLGPALIATGFYQFGKELWERYKTPARKLQRGPCPECGYIVKLHAPAPRVKFQCPQCKTRLIFSSGVVSTEVKIAE